MELLQRRDSLKKGRKSKGCLRTQTGLFTEISGFFHCCTEESASATEHAPDGVMQRAWQPQLRRQLSVQAAFSLHD